MGVVVNRQTSVAMVSTTAIQSHAGALHGDLLDVGCGAMPYKRLFTDGHEWTGITSYTGLDIRPVGDIQSDMQSIDAADGSYDSVLCVDTLQFSVDPRGAIVEMARVLKHGGTLLLVCPNVAQEDEAALFSFKMAGLDYMTRFAGLKPTVIQTASKLWEHEFGNYSSTNKYGAQLPADIDGFIGFLDTAFPAINVVVAVKE